MIKWNGNSQQCIALQNNVVYGHYGRPEDLQVLVENNVDIKDALLIIRYGRIHPASKVFILNARFW
jgi:hypothetical protein